MRIGPVRCWRPAQALNDYVAGTGPSSADKGAMPEIVLKDALWQVYTTLQLVYELALTERLEREPRRLACWRA